MSSVSSMATCEIKASQCGHNAAIPQSSVAGLQLHGGRQRVESPRHRSAADLLRHSARGQSARTPSEAGAQGVRIGAGVSSLNSPACQVTGTSASFLGGAHGY